MSFFPDLTSHPANAFNSNTPLNLIKYVGPNGRYRAQLTSVRFYPKYNELKGLVGAKFYASNAEGLGKTQVASVDTEPTGGWNSYEIDLDTPVSRIWLEVERGDGAGWHCHVTELAFNGIQVFASPACPIVVNTHTPPTHFSFGQVASSFAEESFFLFLFLFVS
jgi:hypothetical protein